MPKLHRMFQANKIQSCVESAHFNMVCIYHICAILENDHCICLECNTVPVSCYRVETYDHQIILE